MTVLHTNKAHIRRSCEGTVPGPNYGLPASAPLGPPCHVHSVLALPGMPLPLVGGRSCSQGGGGQELLLLVHHPHCRGPARSAHCSAGETSVHGLACMLEGLLADGSPRSSVCSWDHCHGVCCWLLLGSVCHRIIARRQPLLRPGSPLGLRIEAAANPRLARATGAPCHRATSQLAPSEQPCAMCSLSSAGGVPEEPRRGRARGASALCPPCCSVAWGDLGLGRAAGVATATTWGTHAPRKRKFPSFLIVLMNRSECMH